MKTEKERKAAYYKKWAADNKERKAAYMKEWRAATRAAWAVCGFCRLAQPVFQLGNFPQLTQLRKIPQLRQL